MCYELPFSTILYLGHVISRELLQFSILLFIHSKFHATLCDILKCLVEQNYNSDLKGNVNKNDIDMKNNRSSYILITARKYDPCQFFCT